MNILELFCGTKSFSNIADKRGHRVFTADINSIFKPDFLGDIRGLVTDDVPFKPDIIWASPPCQCFSVASIGTHWTGGKEAYIPKTQQAQEAIKLIQYTLKIIEEFKPIFWFVENPRCVTRKLSILKPYKRITITYCQYGDSRMKPTDLWTNTDIKLKPPCKNGASCHVSAPRGSRTGTQGLKNSMERGRVPSQLCLDIIRYCENGHKS